MVGINIKSNGRIIMAGVLSDVEATVVIKELEESLKHSSLTVNSEKLRFAAVRDKVDNVKEKFSAFNSVVSAVRKQNKIAKLHREALAAEVRAEKAQEELASYNVTSADVR